MTQLRESLVFRRNVFAVGLVLVLVALSAPWVMGQPVASQTPLPIADLSTNVRTKNVSDTLRLVAGGKVVVRWQELRNR